ncbi:MAG: metallophosphoesterase [Candidatus Electrothrix scaldis]|nr:MAG: metallophosphoesterase [Candidatus Electrothrix sp. GW3-3]
MSSSTLYFLIFFTIALGVHALMHYYFWRRMVKDTDLSRSGKRFGTAAVLALFLLLPVSRLLLKFFSFHQLFPLLWLAYLWLGILMLFFFFFLFADILKNLFKATRCITSKKQTLPDPGRRRFLARSLAASASVLVLGTSAFAIKKCIDPPTVNTFSIKLTGFPPGLKGFSLVQISDIHIGAMSMRAELEEIVAIVNELQPDLVAITGDLMDGTVEELAGELSPLAKLKAPHGVFFVTGNHEYYSGVEKWLPEIERLGITVLNNSRIEIRQGSDAFVLAGVTDDQAGKFGKEHAPDFNKALGGISKTSAVVLLAHQPRAVEEASQYGVDLVLSGHMHGGQIWPFMYLAPIQQPYLKGFYQHNKTLLYVSQGTGYWGPPMRLGTSKEITKFILS